MRRRLQREVNGIVAEELARLEDKNVQHAAVVVLHNPTGEGVRAISSQARAKAAKHAMKLKWECRSATKPPPPESAN
mgnify:CR=1 FL=1